MKNAWIKAVFGVVIAAVALVISYFVAALPLAEDVYYKKNNDLTWSVGFSDAYRTSITGRAKELNGVKFDKTFASFYVVFAAPGDSATYDFVIKNTGKIDAKVESIYVIPKNKFNNMLLFTVSGVQEGDYLLVGESKTLTVKAEFDPNYNGKSGSFKKEIKVIVNYVQK